MTYDGLLLVQQPPFMEKVATRDLLALSSKIGYNGFIALSIDIY